MSSEAVINFLNRLETNGVISEGANKKIQDFFDSDSTFFGRLFLVICGIIGSLFASAGVFSIVMHNWDDFPKMLKAVISLAPLLVGLYFYYLAIFKHKGSVVWAEASSVFLMLMIGASIALVAETYHLNGDFYLFIKVWLGLTVPLFYIRRASGIAVMYISLALYLAFPSIIFGFFGLIPSDFHFNDHYYWFWIYFMAFLPHYLWCLKKDSRKQGPRVIFLGWIIAFGLLVGTPVIFKGGYLFWLLALITAYQFVGHRYYANNLSIVAKPFQFVSYFALYSGLLLFSEKHAPEQIFRSENLQKFSNFELEHKVYYLLGFLAMIASVIVFRLFSDKKTLLMKFVFYFPILILFMMGLFHLMKVYDVDLTWIGYLLMNLFVLGFGISAMIHGHRERKFTALFYGLFLICQLLWYRYFDLDISFWLKGLLFIAVGGFFFFINFVIAEDVDTGEQEVE